MKKIITILLITLCISCNVSNNENNNDLYSDITVLNSGQDIIINTLQFDTIKTNTSFTYSGDAFWKLRDDSLYYFDRLLGTVDIFNLNGEFMKRALGIGKGPNEVMEEIGTVCDFHKGWLLVAIYNVFQFSRSFNDKKTKFLLSISNDWGKKKQDLQNNPNPTEDIELYVPAYINPQMTFLNNQSVIMKVSCEYPDFREKKYYTESAIVAEYNFEKGTLTKLMGKYPPSYKTENYTTAFANHYYSKYKEDTYLLSFGIDPLIYICDDSFKPQKAFGLCGKMINVNYDTKNSNNKTNNHDFKKERIIRGYYTSIYYCKEKDLTFRIYKTGIKEDNIPDDLSEVTNPSRMQIYKGTDLIGDVSVPELFEIISYKAPYYFSDGYLKIEEDYDIIGFYKFKIN